MACANQKADKNLSEAEQIVSDMWIQGLKDFSGNKATQEVAHEKIISQAILTSVNHPPGGQRQDE